MPYTRPPRCARPWVWHPLATPPGTLGTPVHHSAVLATKKVHWVKASFGMAPGPGGRGP